MSEQLSVPLSVELSEHLSPYNVKDKDNNKDNSNNNARENESSLDELELRLSNDTSWQESIISLLSSSQQIKLSHTEIENYINQFFQYLKISGIERREETEVRTYFFNWLKKTILNNKKPQSNVEALMYRLLHQRSIKERFRLSLSKDDARAALKTAVQAEVQHRHREFVTNEAFEMQLDRMAENLTGNNGKFGIALCGYCGNGKTTCVKALQQLINALQIHDSYDNSTYGLCIMTANEIAWKNKNDFSSWERIKTIPLLAIDDLGTEPREILDYGNVLNPIVDLLTKRYDEQLFTIFTTNLTLVQIREKYGDRIADRLNEMMDIIEFTSPTYRMK